MKRLLALLLLCASAALAADQATLAANTVLRTGNSLVILKAGTVVQIISRSDKTVTVKSGDKTGMIPWSALVTDDDMMSAPQKRAPTATPLPAPTPVVATAGPVPTSSTGPGPVPAPAPKPADHPKAQTMYGKAVEKAAAAADSHEKAQVQPTDEILGGK